MKNLEITDQQAEELLAEAQAAKDNTYPKSGGYGAAVLADDGKIFQGSAYLSDTYTLTIHAEAAALVNAATNGCKNIVAISGPNCHICKQLIWESSLNSGIEVQIVTKEDDKFIFTPISELMPEPWPDQNGNH